MDYFMPPARRLARPALLVVTLLLCCCGAALIAPQPLHAQAGTDSSALELLKTKRVTLRGENLSVATLLRFIGKREGINLYVDDAIKETITVDFVEISLFDLFMFVIESKGLQYSEKNHVVYVGKREAAATTTAQLCPVNGAAADYVDQLRPLLSAKGAVTVAQRNNCLIVQDQEAVIGRIKEVLAQIDRPASQVHIKASIVAISKDAQRQLGIKWGYDNYRDSAAKAAKNRTVTATAGSVSSTTGNLNLVFGMLQDNLNLDVELNALQQDGLALVLSSPQVLVLDGKEASIKQGQEVSYVATSGDAINTSFKEANLSLVVTPKIQGRLIAMKLQVNNDNVDKTSSTGEPLINTQEIATDLLIRDGETAVIGGIILHSDHDDNDRVPGLSEIPLLGNLFKSTDKKKERSELLVFISAKIISLQNPLPIPRPTGKYLDEYDRMRLLSGEKMEPTPAATLGKDATRDE